MIVGTTALPEMKQMEVVDCFNVTMNVPAIKKQNEILTILSKYNCSTETANKICNDLIQAPDFLGIPIKNFILSIELAI